MSQTGQATINKALTILEKRLTKPSEFFHTTSNTTDYLKIKLANLEYEEFHVLLLNNQHGLIEDVCMFKGTIDGATVYPREVLKLALHYNAAAVILAHNHPSGMCLPSESDRLITERLKEALSLVDIRVLDHIIVGGMDTHSFASKGIL